MPEDFSAFVLVKGTTNVIASNDIFVDVFSCKLLFSAIEDGLSDLNPSDCLFFFPSSSANMVKEKSLSI